MKIYEIISLNEGNFLSGALSTLGRGAETLGRGVDSIKHPIRTLFGDAPDLAALKDKVGSEIGKLAQTKNIPIEKASGVYLQNLETKIQAQIRSIVDQESRLPKAKRTTDPDKLRAKAMQELDIDPRELDPEIVKGAKTSAQLSNAKETLGLKDLTLWKAINTSASGLLKLYGLYEGFYKPWSDFVQEMENHSKELVANKISEQQYNGYMNQEVTILVGRWASQWITGGIFKKIITNKEGNSRFIGDFLLKHLGADLTKSAGVAWFRTQMNDSEFQQWLASTLLMDIADKSQPLAQAIGPILSPIISVPHRWSGGLIGPKPTGADVKPGAQTPATTTPTASTQPANTQQPAAGGATNAQPNAQQTATQPAVQGSTQPAVQGGQTASSQAGLIDIGAGWMKDPKTGAIYPKLQ